ncbi:MAG: hypothetical protein JWM78_525 [Verrucomicrobiaceae bacterium]|nr:hypothetical protein [Verrucomicrobiaceae bacterium]
MNNLLAQFHFLRPAWLLLLMPVIFIAVALYRKVSSGANWRRAIAPELIDYLLEPGQEQRRNWAWLLAATWLLATLAMAGPTWEKAPQPVLQKRDALVIVLDLSLSMYAEDIKPSRLQRARYKILDTLKQRREGLTGLVVFSGDAHVVSPLTDDTATIANLVPALAPAMMPNFGSDSAAGVEEAIQLLKNSGFERGRILLISDDIDSTNADQIAAKISHSNWQLSMIGVGTEQGAPIPTQGGFLKSASGSIAIAQMHRATFAALAQKTNGHYSDLRLDDSDLNALLPDTFDDANSTRTVQREFDQWRERGPQLVLLLLPLAAFAFRRGWLLIFLLLPLSAPSQAQDWNAKWRDLWQRPDQQAQRLFSDGDSKDAAQKFTDPTWRGAAQYRSGDYEEAAKTLSNLASADAQYNRGNALAQAGKLQEAITAYDAALKINPNSDDTKFNRDLVQKLLQQQQKEQSSQQQKNDKQQNKDERQNASSQQQQDQQKNGDGQQQNNESNSGKGEQSKSEQANNPGKSAEEKSGKDSQSNPADGKPAGDDKNQTANSAEAQSPQDKETQQNNTAANESEKGDKSGEQKSAAQTTANDKLSPEQQQQQRATEQWLRQIPDDPAGLLRRKFLYEYRQRQRDPASRSDQQAW